MRQNDEDLLRLLRAREHTYTIATYILITQLTLTLGIPIIGGVISGLKPATQAWFAAASLAVILIDGLFLDRQQKLLIRNAAKIGEQFDCTVLDLPWNHFLIGNKVDPEDVHSAARAYAARRNDQRLKDWYPTAALDLPIEFARMLCQRTNLRYDSKLRRSYGAILKYLSLLITTAFVIFGLVQNGSVTTWVLAFALATPFFSWAAREYYRQIDTASAEENLMREARKLWDKALVEEIPIGSLLTTCRELQDAIYNHRASSPMILPFLYHFKRPMLEHEMQQTAAELARDRTAALSTSNAARNRVS